jgi:tetratricopeptide (TPR) repeat protein
MGLFDFLGQPNDQQKQAGEFLKQAIDAANNKNFREAVSAIDLAATKDPSNSNYLMYRGYWRYELQDYQLAAQDLNNHLNFLEQQALKSDSVKPSDLAESAETYFRLGLCCQKFGDSSMAVTCYGYAAQTWGMILSNFKTWMNVSFNQLSGMRNQMGLPPLARPAQVYSNLAGAQFQEKKFDLAIDNATIALSIEPNYGKAFLFRGLAYQTKASFTGNSSDLAKAKTDLQKASSLGESSANTILQNMQ